MFKVIVERPRHGRWIAGAPRPRAPYDDLPSKEGIRRPHTTRGAAKSLNENLAPLRRYLKRNVGRPWDKVYSEICAGLKGKSTVKQHVREHVPDFVSTRAYYDEGGRLWVREDRFDRPTAEWYTPFFVDPRTGILRRSGSVKNWVPPRVRYAEYRRRDRRSHAVDLKPVSELVNLRRVDGVWYEFRREPAPPGDPAWERFREAGIKDAVPMVTRKRQLSRKALHQHGLSNEPC
jgi:hypothetical protein